jgi:hypothetical protein
MFIKHTSRIFISLSKLHVQPILTFISLPLQQQVNCITHNISPYPLFPTDLIPLQSDVPLSTLFTTFIPMWGIYLGNKDACCIFKICCVLFPTKLCVLHNLIFFLLHTIFTSNTKGMLKFKCPTKSFKGQA